MAYVVTDNCIKCKYTDCVEVCPTDSFHEGENFVVISDDCVDCDLCVAECPANAIFYEEDVPKDQVHFIPLNIELSLIWPNITSKKDALEDADHWDGKDEKFRYLKR